MQLLSTGKGESMLYDLYIRKVFFYSFFSFQNQKRLKEIRQNNEVRGNEFSQSFSSIPKNSFVENIQLLKMTGKGQTAKNTHMLNKLNAEKGTLQNYLKIIQERKKIVQDQVNKIKEYNLQLQNDIEHLKKEKKDKEEQNYELKKQKLMNIRKYILWYF